MSPAALKRKNCHDALVGIPNFPNKFKGLTSAGGISSEGEISLAGRQPSVGFSAI
jgi:hypothetical protein